MQKIEKSPTLIVKSSQKHYTLLKNKKCPYENEEETDENEEETCRLKGTSLNTM